MFVILRTASAISSLVSRTMGSKQSSTADNKDEDDPPRVERKLVFDVSKPLRVCILHVNYDKSESAFKSLDPTCDPSPHFRVKHQVDHVFVEKQTAVKQVTAAIKKGYDLFVNLCDGAWDEDRPGVEVVLTLERAGVAFTGATSKFYEPSRAAMKLVSHYMGVRTPIGFFCRTETQINEAANVLKFPVIVKHYNSYGSIGMTKDNRVETREKLWPIAKKMIDEFGECLVEEFIVGREFTVLVAENAEDPNDPTCFRPIEFKFPENESFKHFNLKWVGYQAMTAVPVDDAKIELRLREMASRVFRGLRGSGYGRCDIRMNEQGDLFLLEMNPNCGVFYPVAEPGSADFILQIDPRGGPFFVDLIFKSALKRKAEREKVFAVRMVPGRGFGMFATKDLKKGDMVNQYEEKPHFLVSNDRVKTQWDSTAKEWFDHFSYPLSPNLSVMWDEAPENWCPINHSCDPNTWLEGLDVVARRDIALGEELTMDYCTFCGPTMAAFDCGCGSSGCRKRITGEDCRGPAVEKYGRHVSDYVMMCRGKSSCV